MINYRRLTKTDLPQVIAFYKDACDHQQFDQYSPDWTWGVYPSEQSLEESLNDYWRLVPPPVARGSLVVS